MAQRTITGVVSSNDTAVVGATVLAKGTTVATKTGNEGSFSISVPANSNTLVITSIGYEQQEVAIGNNASLRINLKSLATNLNEVVVVGYGTQKRKDLTGSVSSIGADLIEKVPVVSATQALQGRASGVQITNNDGAPGGNISVLIRGIGSLAAGGNNPLYVIDGYPTQGGINNINPNDIASIDVLKDASSTAIYGIRAANGVIIITTKKGFKNRTQISADMYQAVQTEPKKYDLLNAQQFSALSNDVARTQSNYVPFSPWRNAANLHTVDWQDAVYRTGLTQNYSLAIRGGGDKVQTAASFGYYNQKGIVIGSYFKRFTVGLNLDYQPYKWLRSSTSLKYSNQDANTPLGTSGTTGLGGLFNVVINPPTLD
ncbi:MAG: SusC/RagA family TonB-linked outer membrane protein, partial [Hymenobacter sp.]